ncbi:MAG TPA: PilX N-terminal domain-containing pilus assembly protein [Acidobacteriota bacterium]|nr:PilX N-terminal domain-containing pilus assembly protein [Acidobacteriota bacterium]
MRHPPGEDGIALLLVLLAVSILSLLGLYVALNATADARISDNFESHIQAKYAAQAGLNHARALLRGLDFDGLLRGPDGVYDGSALAQARSFGFRNPVSWSMARSLNILNPAADLAGSADDGVIGASVVLIPKEGIALTAPNPQGPGTLTTGRYFVKVSDNNGEASELAGDPADNPFVDGDGTVIVRSMGIGQTIHEAAGVAVRRNSVVVFEARFRHRSTFNLISPLTVAGNNVNATFDESTFRISGGAGPGIGTVDTTIGDNIHPDQIILQAAERKGSITGGGLPSPSIRDLTDSVLGDPEKALLLDPEFLWNFVTMTVARIADNVFDGDQTWDGGAPSNLGTFDVTKRINDPAQDPRVTLVNGGLTVSGNVTGGGLLVIRGDFRCNPGFSFKGLILVIGTGKLEAISLDPGVVGGVFLASVNNSGGVPAFGTPDLLLGGNSTITADASAVKMAIGLLPPSQISYREVTSVLDPP